MNIAKAVIMTMVIALVMIGTTGFAAATYTSVILEDKDASWNPIVNNVDATIVFDDCGSTFTYHASGTAPLANTSYSLIYYADYPDRFNQWGGDNPGALIGTMMTDSFGDFNQVATITLHDLPCAPDANMNASEYNYTASDGYTNANGAKLWMVPSADYDAANKKVNKWNPTQWLFETDLITYTNGTCTFSTTTTISIDDAFNVDTVPIVISDAFNVGAVDLVLSYNASLVTVTGVTGGDMDVMIPNIGSGQVQIGAFQTGSPGLGGTFDLADVSFAPVGNGTCPFVITVTTFKDATPAGNAMAYQTSCGTYSTYLNGDVNGDGVVDMFDAMYLAKNVLGISGFENMIDQAADVDGSGNVDIADASYLAKYILGITGYETLN